MKLPSAVLSAPLLIPGHEMESDPDVVLLDGVETDAGLGEEDPNRRQRLRHQEEPDPALQASILSTEPPRWSIETSLCDREGSESARRRAAEDSAAKLPPPTLSLPSDSASQSIR